MHTTTPGGKWADPVWDESAEAGEWVVSEVDGNIGTIGGVIPRRFTHVIEIPRTRIQFPALSAGDADIDPRIYELEEILAQFTSGTCHFALWKGWGFLHSKKPRKRTQFHGPTVGPDVTRTLDLHRTGYFLWTGELRDAHLFGGEGVDPSLMWPDDRRWFMGSTVDSTATYLAGDMDVVNFVLDSDVLDARMVIRNQWQAYLL